jgi:signal peptidase I
VASKRPGKKNVVEQARSGNTPRRGRKAWESFKSIIPLILIFLAIRAFIIEAYRIPSGSMIPSMLVGDWLFVNKFIYGLTIPFTNTQIRIRVPGTGIRFYRDPRRNDIVVFRSPPQSDQPWDPTPTLVKRVIGMPGDTIYMRRGVVSVNGTPQQGEFLAPRSEESNAYDALFEWQHGHELPTTRFGPPPARPTLDNWGPLLVPAEHYLMLGDNRHGSKDSRFWGLVPRRNVRGQPLFVYYSFDPECGSGVCFLTDIRWRRIGHVIR